MKRKESFIKLDRRIQKWVFYQDGNVLRVFLELLLSAEYEDNEGIRRGQVAISLRALSNKLGLGIKPIRTALSKLEETNTIKRDGSIITICNYNKYQANRKKEAAPLTKAEMEAKKIVPPEFAETFGTDFEAYINWRNQ